MTQEQIEMLKNMLNETKNAISEVEQMLEDIDKCNSEISKKYLSAAIKKQASTIAGHMKNIE